MTPEQHEQQRLWVTQSLQAEAQRERNRDTYPRRTPRESAGDERARTEAGADGE